MDNLLEKNITISPDAWNNIKRLCQAGKKLEAVKFYKLNTNKSLKESKEDVEYICNKEGIIITNKFPKGLKIAIPIILILFIIIIVSTCGKTDSDKTSNSSSQETNKIVKQGEILHTQYFDIRVNQCTSQNELITEDGLTDLKPEQGSKFIIVDVTFKNTSTESRMMFEGALIINYNGKDYTFDKNETIMSDGYGLFLEEINPLTSKRTKLVYKVPDELKGKLYYNPGRADVDQVIFLGTI
jgi:hypothetical protein